jgi:hypothetical protein
MRRKRLQVRVTPEFLRSRARRDASDIGRFGWRPTKQDLANLRASKQDAIAYRTMLRAWRSVGFRTEAIRRLAGRKPKTARAPLAAIARAELSSAASHDHQTRGNEL